MALTGSAVRISKDMIRHQYLENAAMTSLIPRLNHPSANLSKFEILTIENPKSRPSTFQWPENCLTLLIYRDVNE